jgi:hypothetical protein
LRGNAHNDLLDGAEGDNVFRAADGERDSVFGGPGDDRGDATDLLDMLDSIETLL